MTYDPHTERVAPVDRLKVRAAQVPTDTLVGALVILDRKANLSPDERMTSAAMSDVIEERHNLTDRMDATFSDDAYAGSYTDALLAALTASGWKPATAGAR